MTIELSNHARIQASRRNFSYDDIRFVVKHGHREHRTGVIFFQMRDKRVPRHIPANDSRRKLVGATIVVCRCGEYVITLYKNPKAFKKDSRKSKRNCREIPCNCPCCGTDMERKNLKH